MSFRIPNPGCVILFTLVTSIASAERWYVDRDTPALPGQQTGATWALAFADLQLLFDYDPFKQDIRREVWVANGVYKPTRQNLTQNPDEPANARAVTYKIPRAAQIYGGFRGQELPFPGESTRNERNPAVNLTTLSGDINGDDDYSMFPDEPHPNNELVFDDNAYHVVTLPDTDANDGPTRLSGFIIVGGYADGAAVYGHTRGGGVKSILLDQEDIGGAQFNLLTVIHNYASEGGGGIHLGVKDFPFSIANCRFEKNAAGGAYGGAGLFSDATLVDLMNCVFFDNHVRGGYGGGAAITGPTLTQLFRNVVNCTFANNSTDNSFAGGGGLYTDCTRPNPDPPPFDLSGTFVGNSIFWGNLAGDVPD